MMNLPSVLFSEDKAVAAVTDWVGVVEQKMTAPASREWLEATLRDFLRNGLIETLKVIEAADAGDEIADAALRRVYAEMSDVGEVPATLKAYGIKSVLRGPVVRSAGRNTYDNWQRDIGIACLVYLAKERLGLRPTPVASWPPPWAGVTSTSVRSGWKTFGAACKGGWPPSPSA